MKLTAAAIANNFITAHLVVIVPHRFIIPRRRRWRAIFQTFLLVAVVQIIKAAVMMIVVVVVVAQMFGDTRIADHAVCTVNELRS